MILSKDRLSFFTLIYYFLGNIDDHANAGFYENSLVDTWFCTHNIILEDY